MKSRSSDICGLLCPIISGDPTIRRPPMRMPGGDTELALRLTEIVRSAPSLMQVLRTTRMLGLPDWLVMSGAVYQRVLNCLTGRAPDYGIRDYDLGYFDASDISYEAEDLVIRRVAAAFDEPLKSTVEVRNQARVHVWFEAHFGEAYTPLSCTAEALERFVSPMFAVGVRLAAGVLCRWPELRVEPASREGQRPD